MEFDDLMKNDILDLLHPETSEPRNKPLSIPVTESQLRYYRETCEIVHRVKGKNTVPKVAGACLMDLCKEIRRLVKSDHSGHEMPPTPPPF